MPKLMTRTPRVERSGPPSLRPAIRIDYHTTDVAEQRLYDWGVKEERVGDPADGHEVENRDDAGSGQSHEEGYFNVAIFTIIRNTYRLRRYCRSNHSSQGMSMPAIPRTVVDVMYAICAAG